MSGLPAPIEMPSPLPVNSKSFDLVFPQLITPVGAGFIQTIDRGPNMWAAQYATPPLDSVRDQAFQSFLDQLRGSMNTFLGFDPRRTIPFAYYGMGGGTPWGAGAEVTANDFSGSTLTLDGFSADAVLTGGDYISYQNGSIWYLYRVVLGPYVADGSGAFTSPVQVIPRPPDTISSPIALRLNRAACAMKILSGIQKTDKVTDMGPSYTFTAAQFIDRSS